MKKPGQYEFRCKCGKLLFTARGAEDVTVKCRGCGRFITVNFSAGNTFIDRVVKK